jgi:hypothetical protein
MNQINRLLKLVIAISIITLAGCSSEKDVVAVTAKLPTDTRIPSTATPIPPTDTPIPPTDTPVLPTDTPPPPSDTPFPVTDTPVLPTEEFTRTAPGGDGYVAHIPISEAKGLSSEEIVTVLVTQLLEHYRTETSLPEWRLSHYDVEDVTIVYEAEDKSPFIKAAVQYSVIPDTPWFSGAAITITESCGLPWYTYTMGFAVHGNVPGSSYYWLRQISLAVLYGL